jgi:ABC-type transport system substrate-binding protein
VTLLFHSSGTNQIAHYVEGWQPDEEIDRLIEQGRAVYDIEERKEIYSELQERVMDLVYGQIPIVFPQSGYGLSKGVQNFQFYPDLKYSIREAWLQA